MKKLLLDYTDTNQDDPQYVGFSEGSVVIDRRNTDLVYLKPETAEKIEERVKLTKAKCFIKNKFNERIFKEDDVTVKRDYTINVDGIKYASKSQ